MQFERNFKEWEYFVLPIKKKHHQQQEIVNLHMCAVLSGKPWAALMLFKSNNILEGKYACTRETPA